MKTKVHAVKKNPFHAKKAQLTAALRRATSIAGAARIVAKELNVPFQLARGVLLQNDRKVKRLCATR